MLTRLSISGDPNLGVYARATETHVFVAMGATGKEQQRLAEALDVELVVTSIGGTRLVGSLLAANRHGIVTADILSQREHAVLEATGLPIATVSSGMNAAGNLFVANDNGAMVGPGIDEAVRNTVSDTLRVPVVEGVIGGIPTLGMAAIATSRGVLVHPKTDAAEIIAVEQALGVRAMPGTINHGNALVGAGVVANSKGAAFGRPTTGIEIGRIDEALGFLDAEQHRTV